MKQVGLRKEPALVQMSTGALLAAGARFSETISRLAPTTFIPKGVYRFRTHEEANLQRQDCLVRGMGLLAATRA